MNTAAAAYMGISKEEPHPHWEPEECFKMGEFLRSNPYVLGEPPILNL